MMPGENSVSLYVPAEQVQNTSFLSTRIYNPHDSYEGYNILYGNGIAEKLKDLDHQVVKSKSDIVDLEFYNFNLQKNIPGFNIEGIQGQAGSESIKFTISYAAEGQVSYDVLVKEHSITIGNLDAGENKLILEIPLSKMFSEGTPVDTISLRFGGDDWKNADNLHIYSFDPLLPKSFDAPPASPDNNGVKILMNDKYLEFNSDMGEPFVDQNDRTQVPLRITMESYGCTVEYDKNSKTVIVKKDDVNVNIPIGEKYIIVNDKIKAIDTEAIIRNNRTYLPIRAVLEAFGAEVSWNMDEKTVAIN
jgi:hypothetical protein